MILLMIEDVVRMIVGVVLVNMEMVCLLWVLFWGIESGIVIILVCSEVIKLMI